MNELNFMHENISGILNYCDRWCEKCSYINRCLLFKQEAETEIKHILRDENKNHPDAFAKDLSDNFNEAFDHINKFMDEENEGHGEFEKEDLNIDDQEEDDDDERPSTFLRNNDTALILHSEKLYKDFYKSYDHISLVIATVQKRGDYLNILRNNLDILRWYMPQIHVKIRMSYRNKHQLSKSTDTKTAEIDREMLNVFSRIAFVGIENCINALAYLQQENIEPQITITSLLITTNQIRELFVEEFPDALTYRRPYFD